MIESVQGWIDRHKAAQKKKADAFGENRFSRPPKKPLIPMGGPKTRRWKAYQFFSANRPAVEAILRTWRDVIVSEQRRLEGIVTSHDRQPTEREYKNAKERIEQARADAEKAINDLQKGYNERRGKI
jgi:hypothetical protein